ncbi:MAG: nucleoside recognition domain-containing protein, partial [Heliobacteriaceae bacterium]|nr:nucleoside recognition domain-containing protein [Heliobacteriaceae bacterium]
PDPAITEQLALWRRQKQFNGTLGAALAAMEDDEIQREKAYYIRRQQVNRVYRAVVTETPVGATIGAKLGCWLLHPAIGLPVLVGVLGLMYWLLGIFVAGDIVDLSKDGLMQGYYEPFIRNLLGPVIAPESVAGRLFFGEYGILTMPFTLLIGLLLPLVLAFYFFLAMLEDVGYLPRMAVLTDRMLKQIGLSGLAVIPFILGFGCVTLATITTRLLPSERERRIAIFLLGLVIPCSAQLGVLTGLLAVLDPALIGLFVVVMLTIFIGVGTIMDRILPGQPADLVLELPPLQWPHLKNVLRKTVVKSMDFLNEAFPLFVGGALVLGSLQVTGLLTRLEVLASPLTVGWLHLPPETARIFIMGMVRRDLGAAALVDMPLAPEQAVVALITLTLFVPCFAAAMMIFKERPKKEGLVMWLLIWVIAFSTGGVVAQLLATFESILWTAGLFILFLALLAGIAVFFARLREKGQPVQPMVKG